MFADSVASSSEMQSARDQFANTPTYRFVAVSNELLSFLESKIIVVAMATLKTCDRLSTSESPQRW